MTGRQGRSLVPRWRWLLMLVGSVVGVACTTRHPAASLGGTRNPKRLIRGPGSVVPSGDVASSPVWLRATLTRFRDAVVRSPADGHTLLLFTPAAAINVSLFRNLSYNFIRDIAPVAGVLKAPNVLTVGSSLPVRTVPELIAYAKANPHKVNVGHTGNGTGAHLASELFKMLTGTELVMVPYRGNAPAFTDLISGHIHVMFPGPVGLLEHIQAGRLRALAVTSTTRSPALPEVPTLNEHVPGYETTQWYAIGAPRETPADIVTLLNREINAALQDSQINARIAEQGGSAMLGSPADLGKLIADETAKWAAVIERAGIKPE